MTQKIIQMIVNGVSSKEIKCYLNINNDQLINELEKIKKIGYTLAVQYSKNDIYYGFDNNHYNLYNNSDKCVDIEVKSDCFKAIAISDTHLGSKNDRLDLIEKVYEYALNNSITTILHTGDFINGVNYELEYDAKQYSNMETIDYALNVYPKEKSIHNYLILGNHDNLPLQLESIDLKSIIDSKRSDITCLGYKIGKLKLLDDAITLYHPFTIRTQLEYEERVKRFYKNDNYPALSLMGHAHDSKIYNDSDLIFVRVPSLFNNRSNKIKGAWEIQLGFVNNKIGEMLLKPLIVEPNVTPICEISHKIKSLSL